MSTIKQQWELLLTALSFFSRIPIPYKLAFSSENLKRCNRYFPTVGLVVGVIGALVYFPANEILPHSIAVIISMITTILATGAFHEDGFADVCDAFGGGYTKEKIMQIMKDSNVGAYGAIGVALLLLFKFQLLSSISESQLIISLLIGHTLSRSMSVWSMYALPYVREDDSSKSKQITKSIHKSDVIIGISTGCLSLLLLWDIRVYLIFIPTFASKWFLERYFIKWIGGVTGDCLGTIQQVTEVVIYTSLIVYYNQINTAEHFINNLF